MLKFQKKEPSDSVVGDTMLRLMSHEKLLFDGELLLIRQSVNVDIMDA